jgi:hypothetical protein
MLNTAVNLKGFKDLAAFFLRCPVFRAIGHILFKEPLDFLKLFLTEALLMSICIATNQYAEMIIGKGDKTSYACHGQWAPLTLEELYRY